MAVNRIHMLILHKHMFFESFMHSVLSVMVWTEKILFSFYQLGQTEVIEALKCVAFEINMACSITALRC